MRRSDIWEIIGDRDDQIAAQAVKAIANPNYATVSDYTMLMHAAKCRKHETVRVLLERGADPNIIGGVGWTALEYAWEAGRGDVVRLLFEVTTSRRGLLSAGSETERAILEWCSQVNE